MAAQQKKKELQEKKPGPKPALSSKPTRVKNMGSKEQLLDEDAGLKKAPGMGRPGTEENPGRPITNKKK